MITLHPTLQDLITRMRTKTKVTLASVLIGTLVAILFIVMVIWQFLFAGMPRIPDLETLYRLNREPAIEFVDVNRKTIGVRGPYYGRVIAVSDMPDYLWQSFLAIEDAKFYQHDGVNDFAILRAAIINVTSGRTVQGGSTITQQLVKNVLLTRQQTVRRKVQEAFLSWDIEKKFTKDEILTMYMNRVFLGSNAYGVDAASHRYFGKSAKSISLAEAALLAGLLKKPSELSPRTNLKASIDRRNVVLAQMLKYKFITRDDYDRAVREAVTLVPTPDYSVFGYAMDYAAKEVCAKLDCLPADAKARAAISSTRLLKYAPPDLVVQLTIDEKTQRASAAAISEILKTEGAASGASQASSVVLGFDGRIWAMVGGKSFVRSQFNRVTDAKRQPGSAFKTFVYAAAFERGMRPSTIRVDEPIMINGWAPKNYDKEYRGPMTLREAYTRSINTISASVAKETGLKRVVELAQRFGIKSELHAYPAIALGVHEVTLLELTAAQGAIATSGTKVTPYIVLDVRSSRGKLTGGKVFDTNRPKPEKVYDEKLAGYMTSMMKSVVQSGTGRRARLSDREVAGKTGTSQEYRDAWFIGFTGNLIGGVWFGNDDDTSMNRITGGSLPSEVFRRTMEVAHQGLEVVPLKAIYDAEPLIPEDDMASLYNDFTAAFEAEVGAQSNQTEETDRAIDDDAARLLQ